MNEFIELKANAEYIAYIKKTHTITTKRLLYGFTFINMENPFGGIEVVGGGMLSLEYLERIVQRHFRFVEKTFSPKGFISLLPSSYHSLIMKNKIIRKLYYSWNIFPFLLFLF